MDASSFREAVFQVHQQGRERGHYFLTAQDEQFRSRYIKINNQRLLSFGSCSYLGLEFDSRLLQGAIDGYERYGTQTSYSRGYLSCPLYQELEEDLFPKIFDVPRALLLPSTSIAHHVVMPAILSEKDAAVTDHQVHRSVDDAVTLQCARSNAKKVVIKHGELEEALEVIRRLARLHERVWFFCDGVYSMYGDYLPSSFLQEVMGVADNVHLYIDDAHGMSWAGEHGRGHFLSRFSQSKRVLVVTSLAKAFGTGGGVVITKDQKLLETARLVGGPYSFSGPLRPGDLGASVASARLHLSDEIYPLQDTLRARIEQANALCRSLQIPMVIENESPILFVALGRAEAVFLMAEQLREDGFHVNVSGFPAVPASRGGLRIAINAIHSKEEIESLFHSIARRLPGVLSVVGVTKEEVEEQFEAVLPPFSRRRAPLRMPALKDEPIKAGLTVEIKRSIEEIDPKEWDSLFSGLAYIDHASMRVAEKVFHKDHPQREHRWDYRYIFVRDELGIVAAAPFTSLLLKDDIFMGDSVSRALEEHRKTDPEFFTSKAMASGNMVSEGQHVYLRPGANTDAALIRLVETATAEMKASTCRLLVVGDFPEPGAISPLLSGQSLIPSRLPDTHVVHLDWKGEDDFIQKLSSQRRRRHARIVQEQSSQFSVEFWNHTTQASDEDLLFFYELYMRLASRNFRINIFPFPPELLRAHLESGAWEFLVLRHPSRVKPVAFGALVHAKGEMRSLYCGIDYTGFNINELSPYRQFLWQLIRRAGSLGCGRLHLGMDAAHEKQSFGSTPVPTYAFLRDDNDLRGQQLQDFVVKLSTREARAQL